MVLELRFVAYLRSRIPYSLIITCSFRVKKYDFFGLRDKFFRPMEHPFIFDTLLKELFVICRSVLFVQKTTHEPDGNCNVTRVFVFVPIYEETLFVQPQTHLKNVLDVKTIALPTTMTRCAFYPIEDMSLSKWETLKTSTETEPLCFTWHNKDCLDALFMYRFVGKIDAECG